MATDNEGHILQTRKNSLASIQTISNFQSLNRRFSYNSVESYNSLASFTSFEVSEGVQKVDKTEEIEEEENEILTYEESEIRLILLGVISSVILLTCATAFLSIVFRISKYYTDPIILRYEKSNNVLGFPIPTVLIVDYTGYFATYSPITSEFRNDLPNGNSKMEKLPKASISFGETVCQKFHGVKIYSAEYNGQLYFMYPLKDRPVVKYDLESKYHRVLRSGAPFTHLDSSAGVQVGSYFWIILGTEDFQVGTSYTTLQMKSSLWSFEKNVWFEGPDFTRLHGISEHHERDDFCLVSTDRNTAYILIDINLVSYDFKAFQWRNHSSIPWIDLNMFSLVFPICVVYQTKDYSKHIFVSGAVEESSVKWELLSYNIELDTWSATLKSSLFKYAGLKINLHGSIVQVLQSNNLTNLEITKISAKNYEQELIKHQNSVKFSPNEKDNRNYFFTLSVFHKRNYIKNK